MMLVANRRLHKGRLAALRLHKGRLCSWAEASSQALPELDCFDYLRALGWLF